MKEREQLNPTDQMLNFLEDASKNQKQWELMKGFIGGSLEETLIQSGIDIDRIKERIREIDFEKNENKHLP